jgi:hypothetical protein
LAHFSSRTSSPCGLIFPFFFLGCEPNPGRSSFPEIQIDWKSDFEKKFERFYFEF